LRSKNERITNMTDIWHAAFVRWFDHREAGHRIRAAVWGWVTDRIANLLDLLAKGKRND
jgi:hypothetical protein